MPHVIVTARPRYDHPNYWAIGKCFPGGQPTPLEVTDEELAQLQHEASHPHALLLLKVIEPVKAEEPKPEAAKIEIPTSTEPKKPEIQAVPPKRR